MLGGQGAVSTTCMRIPTDTTFEITNYPTAYVCLRPQFCTAMSIRGIRVCKATLSRSLTVDAVTCLEEHGSKFNEPLMNHPIRTRVSKALYHTCYIWYIVDQLL